MQKINKYLLVILVLCLAGTANAQFFNWKKSKDKPKKAVDTTTRIQNEEVESKTESLFIEGQKHYLLEDFSKALAKFVEVTELDDQNAAAHYMISKIYLESADLEKAALYAQKAKNIYPDNKYYYLQLAEVYREQANYEKAADVIQQMLDKVPGTDEYRYNLAAIYFFSNQYDKALEQYAKLEKTIGTNETVILQKQKIHLKQGNLKEAIEEGEKLIEMYPGEISAVVSLAEILLSNDKLDMAANYLETFVDKYPNNPQARLVLAEIYKRQDRLEDAEVQVKNAFDNPSLDLESKLRVMVDFVENFSSNPELGKLANELAEKLVKTYPEEADVYAIYGDLEFARNNKAKARDLYLKAIKHGQPSFSIWQNVISIELERQELDSVIVHGNQAMELFPNQSSLYYFLGTAYLMNKDHQEAVAIFQEGINLAANNQQLKSVFYGQLGDAYHGTKDFAKAFDAYDKAIEINPENHHVLNNYSYYLSIRKEDLDKAQKMAARAVRMNPGSATYLDTYGWVLYVQGNYKEAKKYLEKAVVNSEEPSGTILEHYGDALYKLGEVDKAIEQWKKAKAVGDEVSDVLSKKIADKKLYEE